jgi:molybdenum cofactor cytidylyltransferase
LSSQVLRELLAAWMLSGKPMTACAYANTIGPPSGFAREKFDELMDLNADHGARSLLQSNLPQVHVNAWPDGSLDIDTPQDWERFERS